MDIATDKALNILGDLVFDDGDGLTPANASPISGLVILSGSDAHITGDHCAPRPAQGGVCCRHHGDRLPGNPRSTDTGRQRLYGFGQQLVDVLLEAEIGTGKRPHCSMPFPPRLTCTAPWTTGTTPAAQVIAQRYIAADTGDVVFYGAPCLRLRLKAPRWATSPTSTGSTWPDGLARNGQLELLTVLFWDEANECLCGADEQRPIALGIRRRVDPPLREVRPPPYGRRAPCTARVSH